MESKSIRNTKMQASEDGSELQVAAAVSLRPCDNVVRATIPLADANSYAITLPLLGECPGAEFTIIGVRASGNYVDGQVTVVDHADGAGGQLTTDGMSATADRLHIKNCGGKFYATLADVTT